MTRGIEVGFVVAVLFGLVAWNFATSQRTQSQITQPFEERFHRVDAVELMEALCLFNEGLRCPDPYDLPRYHELIRQKEQAE